MLKAFFSKITKASAIKLRNFSLKIKRRDKRHVVPNELFQEKV